MRIAMIENAHADDFSDYLTSAIFTGSCEDLKASLGILDNQRYVEVVRIQLEKDWGLLEQAADLLLEHGTVSGREVLAALTRAPAEMAS